MFERQEREARETLAQYPNDFNRGIVAGIENCRLHSHDVVDAARLRDMILEQSYSEFYGECVKVEDVLDAIRRCKKG